MRVHCSMDGCFWYRSNMAMAVILLWLARKMPQEDEKNVV